MNDYDSREDTLKHIDFVRGHIITICKNFEKRGINHDKSALESPEKDFYDLWRPVLNNIPYNTPEYTRTLQELQPALKHHYENNTHHPEHYPDGIRDMSLFDLLEMVVDWKAAIQRKGTNEPMLRNFDATCARFDIGEQLRDIIINTVREFGWE